MKDSYTISKQTAAILAVVLIILIVLVVVGGVRHMDYMKKHCGPLPLHGA